MTLPFIAVGQAQALGKARWLLATYLNDYTTDALASLGAWLGTPPAVSFVGSDLDSVDLEALDTLPALFVMPVSSTVETAPTANGSPYGSSDSNAVWSVRCVVDFDAYGTDTAAVIANVWAMCAAQCLTERMPEAGASERTWIWNCTVLSDSNAPVYLRESQHRASSEVQIQVDLRYINRTIKTVWPGLGLVPYSPNEAINAPKLTIGGDVAGNVSQGQSASVPASVYVSGVDLTSSDCAQLTVVNQRSYTVLTVDSGDTITPADVPAIAGDVWTITGVTSTNTLRSYRLTWT